MLGNENEQPSQIMRAVSEWLVSEFLRVRESGVLLLGDNFLSLILSRWLTTLVDGFLGPLETDKLLFSSHLGECDVISFLKCSTKITGTILPGHTLPCEHAHSTFLHQLTTPL